ncbi:archaeosortase A [Methanoplanus sp. FWC-SCC4]|uniref:Archaeosortase A n=1 Tax=Methanochimaera problematica TaxID=2609417 RepID=A0AA97I581_9EURY|nr:archaeosortase A [Methanoplanus sp. FWC-SCC4]WOF17176.1 archaeosortase A [Methanoplanus sp. FWC-SCC4]
MAEILLLLSLILFALSVAPTGFRGIFAAGGWIFLAVVFFSMSFHYIFENEFVYPAAAVISVPLLFITVKGCLKNDRTALNISSVAAIAFLIYAAVALWEPLATWLIETQVENTVSALLAIGHPASVSQWDTILSNGYIVVITLSCTPVVGTAIMLGVAMGVESSKFQKIIACVFTIATLAVLNLSRLVFVVVAYSEQWFPYFLDIASNGYPGFESFYWAHNVIGRIIFTILGIVITGGGLAIVVPDVRKFYSDIITFYYSGAVEIKSTFFRKLKL